MSACEDKITRLRERSHSYLSFVSSDSDNNMTKN